MALASSDERDLLLPLYGGIGEDPPWHTFLRRLLNRTRAQHVGLLVRSTNPARPILLNLAARAQGVVPVADDLIEPTEDGLLQIAAIRPNRVYSLEELLVLDDGEAAQWQREALDRSNIAFARFIRIPTGDDLDAWLSLLHDRRDFGAADSALLSAIAPHLGLALAQLAESNALRLRAAIAEDALALIGVGQAAFDTQGRVLAADPVATQELDLQANGRPRLRAREAQALNTACGELADGPEGARNVVRIDARLAKNLLLRPAPAIPTALPSGVATIGLLRRPQPSNEASAARVIAAALGLSIREAALAEAMSRGQAIVDAGTALQLTPETARNYSKRIYAKTGARGQADLVRLVLTGLTPFS